METVRGYSITGYWYKENNQLWHNCGQKGLTVPAYRGILEQFFFFKSKKNLWHSWHTPILTYYCWYKRIIVCQGSWHSLAQLNKLCIPTFFTNVFGARGFFCFFKNFFCLKISLYSIRDYA